MHDSQRLEPLIAHESVAVHADSAYKSQAVDECLAQRGIANGILEKRVRGQVELTPEQKAANRAKSKMRVRVEHPFAWIKKPFGKLRVRYRGMKKNVQHQSLLCAAYNLKRAASMLWPGVGYVRPQSAPGDGKAGKAKEKRIKPNQKPQ